MLGRGTISGNVHVSSLRGKSSVSQAGSSEHRVMDPWMFIMARLLLEFATRQGNTNVSVFSPDRDLKIIRFANFLSRKITTRIITRHGMDKQKLTKSQVWVIGWTKRTVLRKYVV